MSAAGGGSGVVIRGTADPADVAAVLAVLAARRPAPPARSPYEIWRASRLQALRGKEKPATEGL